MDVTHTEHSHVIGKGGGNIKKVMEDTSCHIHFPDSNRHSANGEKSNQVRPHYTYATFESKQKNPCNFFLTLQVHFCLITFNSEQGII